MLNTTRCLIGCTIGDFSSMWYLQAVYPDLSMSAIMPISSTSILPTSQSRFTNPGWAVACGVTTSLLLETTLLRYGKDRLPWIPAAKTAAGMSMISMLTMEAAQNVVDYYLTGGVVQFDSVTFWAAAAISMTAGLLAPLPYNYHRLRKFGKACH